MLANGVSNAWDQTASYWGNLNDQYQLGTRIGGGFQTIGGASEALLGGTAVVAGVATSEVGVGIPLAGLGVLGIAHGSDQASSGLTALFTGQTSQTFTSQGIQSLTGVDAGTASLIDAGIGIGLSAGTGAVTQGLSMTGNSAQVIEGEISASTPVGRLGSPMDVSRGTNVPTVIEDRLYTGHALDQMQGRGLTPSVVEDTISRGIPTAGREGATVYTTEQARVVVNPSGSVKTVMPYSLR